MSASDTWVIPLGLFPRFPGLPPVQFRRHRLPDERPRRLFLAA